MVSIVCSSLNKEVGVVGKFLCFIFGSINIKDFSCLREGFDGHSKVFGIFWMDEVFCSTTVNECYFFGSFLRCVCIKTNFHGLSG